MQEDLAFRITNGACEILISPGIAREGNWTIMATAHRHSQSVAASALRAVLTGRPLETSLLPTHGVIAAFDGARGRLEVVTSVSPGSHISFARDVDGSWVYATRVPVLEQNLRTAPGLDVVEVVLCALLMPSGDPPLEDVRALGLGARLEQFSPGAPRLTHWFSPEPEDLDGDVGDWVEQYCAQIDEVMRVELPESADVSALMSAGLDSTMVVASAANVLDPQRRVTAMCLDPMASTSGGAGSGRWLYSDLPDAVSMADLWANVDVVGLRNDRRLTSLDVLPAAFEHTGLPVMNATNAVWAILGFQAASRAGHELVLTGQSGNATFSWADANVFPRLLQRGKVGHAVGALRAAADATGASGWSLLKSALWVPTRRSVGRFRGVRLSAASVRERVLASTNLPFIRPEVLEDLGLWERIDQSPFSPRFTGYLRRPGLVRSFGMNLVQSLVPGVRSSDPLGAEPLVRLVAALPEEAHVGVGDGRSFARRAMRGRVPDRIRLRTERGQQAADADIWFDNGRVQAQLEELCASPLVRSIIDIPRWMAAAPSREVRWGHAFDRTLAMAQFLAWSQHR